MEIKLACVVAVLICGVFLCTVECRKFISGSGATAKKMDIRDYETKIINTWCSVSQKIKSKVKKCERKMPEKAKQLDADARSFVAPTMSEEEYRKLLCDPASSTHKEVLDFKVQKWEELKDQEQSLPKGEKRKLKRFYKCVAKIAPK